MTFLTDLDEVLRERGVKVKTHPGWKARGYNGLSFAEVRGTLWHHTATNRSAFVGNDAPTLELCMYGRSDLAGPLCQIVLGRDGTAHVIAAGWGNHAGYGSYKGIPANQGNAYLIGVEMESSGIPPYDWTPAQLKAIPVLRDALRDGYRHKLDIGHMEWSSQGKIDPAGLPGGMNWLRTAKADGTTVKPAAVKSKPKPAPKPKPKAEKIVWRMDAGDNLAKIVRYYNGPTTAQIIKANPFMNRATVPLGTVVTIPGKLEWLVERGDSWEKVARYYAVSVAHVKNKNPKIKTLQPGQILRIQ